LINGECFKRKQISFHLIKDECFKNKKNFSRTSRIKHKPLWENSLEAGKDVDLPLGTGHQASAKKTSPLNRDQLLPIKSRETSPTDKQSNKWAALVTSQEGASSDEQRKTEPGNNSSSRTLSVAVLIASMQTEPAKCQ